jgi:hypothetical protein
MKKSRSLFILSLDGALEARGDAACPESRTWPRADICRMDLHPAPAYG